MAHSPHKTWKGCAMCKPHKRRGTGRSVREPWPVLRALGKRRRVRRGEVSEA